MKSTIIALAGGPTSGKSATLKLLRQWVVAENVVFINEVASMLLSNSDFVARLPSANFQRLIYDLQRRLLHLAEFQEPKPQLIISDRGLVDLAAYDPNIYETFSAEELQYAKQAYDLVFLLDICDDQVEINDRIKNDRDTPRIEKTFDDVKAIAQATATAWKSLSDAHVVNIPQRDSIEVKAAEIAVKINDFTEIKFFSPPKEV